MIFGDMNTIFYTFLRLIDYLLPFFKDVLVYMSESAGAPRDQRQAADFLELELQGEV